MGEALTDRTAAEFRSVDRDVPVGLVDALIAASVAYGLILTISLPFALVEVFTRHTDVSLSFSVLNALFAINFIATMCRWCFVHPAAFVGFKTLRNIGIQKPEAQPFVSILVPAYNEAETISTALESLSKLDYPHYEVIVVDDGSLDETYELARAYEGINGTCRVRVVRKANGGKWSALNHGFNLSSGALILCVDADTRLDRGTLRMAVARLMSDSRIGGLAGQVTIRNRNGFLMKLQALEYVLGNGGMRMAMSVFGVVTIVPGAIGLYRRSVLEEVARLNASMPQRPEKEWAGAVSGPLSSETFAEDFQLSMSVLALGHRIVYEPRAVAFTRGPDRVDSLLSQRYRWMRGTWQVLVVYVRSLHRLAKANRPLLPWVVAACYTVDIYVMPVLNFGFWAWLALMIGTGFDVGPIFLLLAAIAVLNVMTATIHILLQRDDLQLVPLASIMDLYLSYLINSAWLIAAIDELRGGRMKWH